MGLDAYFYKTNFKVNDEEVNVYVNCESKIREFGYKETIEVTERDLKKLLSIDLSNILNDENAKDVITDFGISKISKEFEENGNSKTLTDIINGSRNELEYLNKHKVIEMEELFYYRKNWVIQDFCGILFLEKTKTNDVRLFNNEFISLSKKDLIDLVEVIEEHVLNITLEDYESKYQQDCIKEINSIINDTDFEKETILYYCWW